MLALPIGFTKPLRAVLWCAVSSKAQTDEDRYSLPDQEAAQRQLCSLNGWLVVDTLVVPGHSRYYIDIHEVAADMAKQGIQAFNRLMQLWKTQPRAFDVLVCRDFTRFARRASLLTYIVEATLDAGAVIYSLTDGWVTEENSSIVIALAGFKARKDISDLQARKDEGMRSRMDRGLTQNRVPASHKIVYDENHKPDHLELNPKTVRFWQDFATELLAGTPLNHIARIMCEKYGHPAHATVYYRHNLTNPYFWGHSAKGYDAARGAWVWDESQAVPSGVLIKRNTHEPVYAGDLATKVKAELSRRKNFIVGKASAYTKYRFTGLLLCGSCLNRLNVNKTSSGRYYYRCQARYAYPVIACEHPTLIYDEDAAAGILKNLQELEADNSPERWNTLARGQDTSNALVLLDTDLQQIIQELNNLVEKQATAPASAADIYAQKIIERAARRDTIINQRNMLLATSESRDELAQRATAYQELKIMGAANLLNQSPHIVHQHLSWLLGRLRYVVEDREIYGVLYPQSGG